MSATKSLLPEIDLAKIRRYAEGRVPAHARHQVRIELEVSGGSVTIVECRAPWTPEVGPEWIRHPIARLRFGAATSTWMLYWRDRNLVWHRYKDVDATPFVGPLLAEIAADPFCIFWG
jgi:hypothetical protein